MQLSLPVLFDNTTLLQVLVLLVWLDQVGDVEIPHLVHLPLAVTGQPVLAALPHHPLHQLADVLGVLGELTGAVGEGGLHGGVLGLGAGPTDQAGSSQDHWETQQEPHVDWVWLTEVTALARGEHGEMRGLDYVPMCCPRVLSTLRAALYWRNSADTTDYRVPRPAPPATSQALSESLAITTWKWYRMKTYKLPPNGQLHRTKARHRRIKMANHGIYYLIFTLNRGMEIMDGFILIMQFQLPLFWNKIDWKFLKAAVSFFTVQILSVD